MSIQRRMFKSAFPILVVDDVPENLEAFEDEFGEEFAIVKAGNGKDALEIIKKRPEIAVAVIDQRMPEMSGVELLRRIKEVAPHVIRMLITAYADIDVVIDAINTGEVYRYIVKPWDHRELRMTLKGTLERYQLQRERDRLSREKMETLQQLERANRLTAIGSLSAGLAHEIRNPLTSIKTFLDCLPERIEKLPLTDRAVLEDDYWKDLREVACGEMDRIIELLGELRSLAKTAHPVVKEQPIQPIIEQMVSLVERQAEKRGVKIECFVAKDLPRVRLDREKIKQLLLNLMLNGIEAMGKGGKLSVRAPGTVLRGTRHFLTLEVSDTGNGIPKADLARIFDPFFTTRSALGGSGLGLTICANIVEAHRGEIEARSELAGGSTFTVHLPL